MFDCGDYQGSREMLANYISLFATPPAASDEEDNDDDLVGTHKDNHKSATNTTVNANMYYLKHMDMDMLHVLWGRLACDILVQY
jgi:hypothetical protein